MGVRMAKAFLSRLCGLGPSCLGEQSTSGAGPFPGSKPLSPTGRGLLPCSPTPPRSRQTPVPVAPPGDPNAFVSEPASGGRSRAEGSPGLGKGGKQGNPLTIQRSHQTGGEGPSCAFGFPGGPAQGTRAWAPRSAGQRGRWSLASGEVTRGDDVAKDIQLPASSAQLRPLCPAQQHCPLLGARGKCTQRSLPGERPARDAGGRCGVQSEDAGRSRWAARTHRWSPGAAGWRR